MDFLKSKYLCINSIVSSDIHHLIVAKCFFIKKSFDFIGLYLASSSFTIGSIKASLLGL